MDPSISSSSGGAGGAGGKQSQPPQRARHAFLGVGFREREDAFALKACVQDFVAYHEVS